MLYVVPTKESQRENLAAVTHVDGTARLQTVFREQNPRYYAAIERFGQATGIPAVLNTSFNLKGEPVVNTPADAVSTFFRSEMDSLVIGDFLIEKKPCRYPAPSHGSPTEVESFDSASTRSIE
jgi:carbamoyltransferase